MEKENFEDVALIRLQEKYGYERAEKLINKKNKG